ncbi:hypothetical protein [Kordiimonas sp.]|uniref:hypothetical protein n=1 Tax=Kordiimonas sp. TaxID=1970157 RepID=UPI003A953FE8
MKKILLIAALTSLSACGMFDGKGDEIIFDKTLGPATEMQVNSLPNTLEGDKKNARYMNEQLKGENMESTDGSD